MKTYEERVKELEAEGLTTSDAQGAADVEAMRGLIEHDPLTALMLAHRKLMERNADKD